MGKLADILLLCAASISALGAIYLGLTYQTYAIAGCLLAAAAMLTVCGVLPKKK